MNFNKFGKAFALAGALGLAPEASVPRQVKQEMTVGQEQRVHAEVDFDLAQTALNAIKESINADPAVWGAEVHIAELRLLSTLSDPGELVFRATLSNGEEQVFYGDDLPTVSDSSDQTRVYMKSFERNRPSIINFIHGKRPELFAPFPKR